MSKLHDGLLIAPINIATSATHVIVSAVAGQKVYVFRMWWWSAGTVNATIKSDSTALAGPIALIAQASPGWDMSETPWFITTAGEGFKITLDAAIQVSGAVHYTQQ